MNKLILMMILVTVICFNGFSQEFLNGPQREFYLQRLNFPTNPFTEVKDTLKSLSVLWCRSPNVNTGGYFCSLCPENSFVVVDNQSNLSSGWNMCNDDDGSFSYFGFAFYKMNNNNNDDYFYFDFRDCNYYSNGEFGIYYQILLSG